MQCVWKSVMLTLFGTIVIRLEQETSGVWQGLEAAQAGQPVLTIAVLPVQVSSAPRSYRESRKLWLQAEVSQGKRLSCSVMSLAARTFVYVQGKKEKLPICL